MKKALILDLDNTLYSWMDAYAVSFREQLEYLCKSLDLNEDILIKDFKKVFLRYGSVEVPEAVSQLGIWDRYRINDDRRREVQIESTSIFMNGWRKNIRLFPGVRETIHWAREAGYIVIAYSDAFAFWVDLRLCLLGLTDEFDAVYAMENTEISDSFGTTEWEPEIKITYISPSDKKPNTSVVNRILDQYKLNKEQVYYVGDSIKKDIVTAKKAGICDIWAKYGLEYCRGNGRLLSLITPWKKAPKEALDSYFTSPTYTINHFEEIKNIICLV